MVTAEEATRRYAEKVFGGEIVHAKIDIEKHEGYPCCGGTDPDCYCSYYESPYDTFNIVGFSKDGTWKTKEIGDRHSSFNDVLGKLLAEANG